MKYSLMMAALAAPVVIAVPVKRQSTNIDTTVLQFALTLEHLENVFYKGALQKFSQQDFLKAGYGANYYNNIKYIASDEQSHVEFLKAALSAAGQTPTAACTYNFPYTDVNSFVTLSSILEGVGTSAYLGGAPLITSKDYLTAAGSILVTEALHTSLQRSAVNEVPFASPYGTPLDPTSVYTLASAFIQSCPASNPTLPFQPFPALTLATTSGSCEQPDCTPQIFTKRDGWEGTDAGNGEVGSEVSKVGVDGHNTSGYDANNHDASGYDVNSHNGNNEGGNSYDANGHEVTKGGDNYDSNGQVVNKEGGNNYDSNGHEVNKGGNSYDSNGHIINNNEGGDSYDSNGHIVHKGGNNYPDNQNHNGYGNGYGHGNGNEPIYNNGTKPNAPMSAGKNQPALQAGQTATFTTGSNTNSTIPAGSYLTFVSGLSAVSVPASISGTSASAAIPAAAMGQTYVFITKTAVANNKLDGVYVLYGPAILEVAPAAPVIDFGEA